MDVPHRSVVGFGSLVTLRSSKYNLISNQYGVDIAFGRRTSDCVFLLTSSSRYRLDMHMIINIYDLSLWEQTQFTGTQIMFESISMEPVYT